MAYIQIEIVAEMRKAIKALGHNVKFSLRREHYSMVACKIFESDLDFSSLKNPGQIEAPNGTEGAKGEALLFLKAVKAILYGSGYYDRTDAMIDYFDTAWYVNCQLGDYPNGKPYIYKKAKKPKNSRVPVL